MFTGIIHAVGKIAAFNVSNTDARLRVDAAMFDMSDVRPGDSISVNGVCLTAVEPGAHGFSADVSSETLKHTTLGNLTVGARVNLEKALTLSDRLGGHLVSGHVDGVGEVIERRSAASSVYFRIQAPDSISRYIALKGSICMDGVSLTVNAIEDASFSLNIVPHTLQATTLNELQPGHHVNLEVDIIARYLERLLHGNRAFDEQSTITQGFLAEHGFLNT